MNNLPHETSPPARSRIAELIPGAYFYDAWSVKAGDPKLPALAQFQKALAQTPSWVNTCMSLRNRVVSFVGLKNLGALDNVNTFRNASEYQPGERIGIFTLFENTFSEALLGDRDKHLNVTLSVHCTPPAQDAEVVVTVTTVVQVNNFLGRLYMLPVVPMHRLIAPTVLKAVAKA
ncbi:DUF2867 domain-containing protein [Polaromonas hydrogenivorans]